MLQCEGVWIQKTADTGGFFVSIAEARAATDVRHGTKKGRPERRPHAFLNIIYLSSRLRN